MAINTYDTELGPLTVASDGESIIELYLGAYGGTQSRDALTDEAARQIAEYLAGGRTEFTLPLSPQGTAFQQEVWAALLKIPFGKTRTYGEIALNIGRNLQSARAVGMACARNPIWLIIPCHRVIGSGGALTGYAGGLDVKRRLLELENAI